MRTHLTRLLLAAALAVGLVVTGSGGVTAVAATHQVTATEGVNVRSAAGTSGKIIGGLYRGQTVSAVSTAGGWTKIIYPGARAAYVASSYLAAGAKLPGSSQVNPGRSMVTTTQVNLRKGAGLSYGVIKIVRKGQRVTLTGKSSRGFTEIVNGRSTGWLSSQYLTGSASGLPAVIGTRVATTALDIRTTSGSNAKTVAEVKKGTRLGVTGATANGRAQIVYGNAIRWVTARYLANPASNLPSVPALPTIVGMRYATTALNIRSTSSSSYTLIGEVPRGTRLAITGVVRNTRMQIIWNRSVRWVTAQYLSSTRPTGAPAGSPSVEKGLTPNAIKAYRAAIARFPQIKTVYGVRPDSIPDHPSGRALDLMLPNYRSAAGRQLGTNVAAWARANARTLGINYVIWDQHIWNITRNAEGWRYMASRGSDSANHKNHVHITVYGPGQPGH